jgi:hypothetical protein
MDSKLFYSNDFKKVEHRLLTFLNSQKEFLSESTVESPRAVGDAVQNLLSANFQNILGDKICKEYSERFARRAMADLAFSDHDGRYYIVDVKTHRTSTKFNMPNITSVERIARFYEDDANYFVVLMVSYDVVGYNIKVEKIHFVPIEFLGWDCLTIGALGWGQIQIANSNFVTIVEKNSRRSWMIELCDTLLEFYPKEVLKVNKRIAHFEKIKQKWLAKPDPTGAGLILRQAQDEVLFLPHGELVEP